MSEKLTTGTIAAKLSAGTRNAALLAAGLWRGLGSARDGGVVGVANTR